MNAAVRIEATDRPGLERLLRYCARPPFALERLQQGDTEHLIYQGSRPGPGGSGAQILTPLQLIDRLAALVPPPRVHRHRYFGVLAPNSPLRPAVTAMALPAAPRAPAAPPANPAPHADQPAPRRAARYAWALLLARIYEVFPLRCPLCAADMRIIAFLTEAAVVSDILIHLGEPITPPTIAPARCCGRCRQPGSARSIRRPSRHRTTRSISALPGSAAATRAAAGQGPFVPGATGAANYRRSCGPRQGGVAIVVWFSGSFGMKLRINRS